MKTTFKFLFLLTLASIAGDTTSVAQSDDAYNLSWKTTDGGGGGPSSGGSFTLNGTIGQPDASAPMSGGVFTISGGFWPGVTDIRPALSIRHGTGNTVILSWPNPSTGYVLQQTTQLASPPGAIVWTDVALVPAVDGLEQSVSTPASTGHRFFRLKRP